MELQPHVGDVKGLACSGKSAGSKVNVAAKHQAERSDSSARL